MTTNERITQLISDLKNSVDKGVSEIDAINAENHVRLEIIEKLESIIVKSNDYGHKDII